MYELGALTALGVLYEGADFAEWKEKLRGLLRQQYIDLDNLINNEVQKRNILAKRDAIIYSLVSKSVASRLPTMCDDLYTKTLLEHLEGRVKPFRLMELPAELRNWIYSLAMPSKVRVRETTRGLRSSKPYLLQTCAQIRDEASPIYYGQASFRFYFRCADAGLDSGEMTSLLRSWTKETVGKYVKQLRELCLVAQRGNERWELAVVAWSKADDLRVKVSRTPALHARLQEHAREVEATGTALDLGGGSIIAMLTANVSIWRATFAWPTVEHVKATVPSGGISRKDFNRYFEHEWCLRGSEFEELTSRAGLRQRCVEDGSYLVYAS